MWDSEGKLDFTSFTKFTLLSESRMLNVLECIDVPIQDYNIHVINLYSKIISCTLRIFSLIFR